MYLNSDVGEDSWSPLDSQQIKLVNPKGNQPWIFLGMTDAKAEAPILWPPDAKNCLTGKDPDAGKDWRQEGMTEDDRGRGWHHWLDGHEFEQPPGDGEGQGSLVCCSPWGRKESNMTEWMNWTVFYLFHICGPYIYFSCLIAVAMYLVMVIWMMRVDTQFCSQSYP